MANPALLDIDMSAVDFAAAHAELLTLKLNNPRTRPDADSKLRAIAAWANYVDDCALAFQARLYEHATAIADLEGAVEALEADPGVTDHGDLTGLADNDHPQYLLASAFETELVGSASRIIARETSAFDTATAGTTSPQQVMGYTLPASAFANGTILRVRLHFRIRNNDNGNIRTYAYSINFGGSPIYVPSSAHSYTGATAFVERPGSLEFDLAIRSQTAQILSGRWQVWDGGTAPSVGFGNFLTTESNAMSEIDAVAAVDLSSDQLLEVTVANSNAGASIHWYRHFWTVEAL